MIRVNTHEAKTKLSHLLAQVEQKQETIIICRNGVPIAEVIPWQKMEKDPFTQHQHLKNVTFKEDPCLPLEEDDWPTEQR